MTRYMIDIMIYLAFFGIIGLSSYKLGGGWLTVLVLSVLCVILLQYT